MKTGKIILILSALVLIVAVAIFAVILRNAIQLKREEAGIPVTYTILPAGEFDRLYLSGHLDVRIRQGKKCTVEFAADQDSAGIFITNRNGTLHCISDSSAQKGEPKLLPVRITMPYLLEVNARNGSSVYLGFFQSDSVNLTLGEFCKFTGSNNTLKKVTFKTTGNATINISANL